MSSVDRILFPDILRIIAVFAVMMLHVCSTGILEITVLSFEWHIINFYESLTRWSVPIFVMVSGMFFLNPQRKITLSKLYCKNILRIFIALVSWGIFFRTLLVVEKLYSGKMVSNEFIWELLKEYSSLLFGPAWYHLWFLYMIIGLYMLVPILRIFTKNATRKHYQYLFFLYVSFGSILPLIKDFLLLIGFPLKINFEIKELLGFTCYFIMGYFFSEFNVSKQIKRWVYILAFISVVFQIVGTCCISYKIGAANTFFYANTRPNVVIQAIAIFLFVKDNSLKIYFSEKIKTKIIILSKYSFGMYLVHVLFNNLLTKIGFTLTCFNPIFAIPLRTIVTFVLSFAIVCVLDKIPIIRKYCM